jgi:hypothetical protein
MLETTGIVLIVVATGIPAALLAGPSAVVGRWT